MLNIVPSNSIVCAQHCSLCRTYHCVLNIILCAEHCSLCWMSQFLYDEWNLPWILQFFAFISATFNDATGRVARETQFYYVGHRFPHKPMVVRRRMCGNWDFVTNYRVWFLFGMCFMNDYDVSWVPTQHTTRTWYARFKYIIFYG